MWHEGRLRAIAAEQHGLVHRPQMKAIGITDHEIRRRLSSGRIQQRHPGVYYLDCVAPTWKTEVLAGVLAAGPGALASHRAAAVLWGFDAIYGRMIEVTVHWNGEPEPEGVILHRTRRPNPGVTLEGIPITSPERTLIQIAAFVPARTLQKAARSVVSKGLSTVEELDKGVGLYGGRGVAGTRAMRRVVGWVADDKSGSVAEIDLRRVVINAPIPKPIQQLKVALPDGENAYPDFSWPDRLRIVEVDGFEAHGTPEQLEHDLWRQNQLMELGWEIRRFTPSQIRDRPDEVRVQIVGFVNRQPFRAGL